MHSPFIDSTASLIAASTGWSVGHLVLLVTGIALLMAAGWSRWRRRSVGANSTPPPVDSAAADDEEVPEPPSASGPRPAIAGMDTTEDGSGVEDLFFSASVDASHRRCPECHRRFPAAFDICPFDTTALEETAAPSDADARSGAEVTRRYCTDCGRRYEGGARHCLHDGQLLRHDSSEVRDDAPVYRICTRCGWHSADTDRDVCPRDDHRLIILDPTQRHTLRPPFPFNRCRQCGHVASPQQVHCPVDGTTLLPATSAAPTAIASTGFGARRRVCPECGTRFDDQCRFCSHDGTRLVALN